MSSPTLFFPFQQRVRKQKRLFIHKRRAGKTSNRFRRLHTTPLAMWDCSEVFRLERVTFKLGNSSDVWYRLPRRGSPFLLIIRPLRSTCVGVEMKLVVILTILQLKLETKACYEFKFNLEWKSCQKLLFLATLKKDKRKLNCVACPLNYVNYKRFRFGLRRLTRIYVTVSNVQTANCRNPFLKKLPLQCIKSTANKGAGASHLHQSPVKFRPNTQLSFEKQEVFAP